MNTALHFVLEHGYSIVFLWVTLEQLGLPIPAIPVLVAVGALAGSGQMNVGAALLIAVLGSLIADLFWYEVGRRRGIAALRLLCRVSLEPDSCVRQTELAFQKMRWASLLLAKFVPGVSTAAPPLAGVFGVSRRRFLLLDAAGAVLWAGTFFLLGWIFRTQLESLLQTLEQLGGSAVKLVLLLLALYIVAKLVERKLFIRKLRIARIDPSSLYARMQNGEEFFIVDLRSEPDFQHDSRTLPGAMRMSPAELEARHPEIPRDRDIILYCT
jgi:membrane protein DedA with SNARE-associated domain